MSYSCEFQQVYKASINEGPPAPNCLVNELESLLIEFPLALLWGGFRVVFLHLVPHYNDALGRFLKMLLPPTPERLHFRGEKQSEGWALLTDSRGLQGAERLIQRLSLPLLLLPTPFSITVTAYSCFLLGLTQIPTTTPSRTGRTQRKWEEG